MSDGATVRAFVALEMPEWIREVIGREQRHLKAKLPRARWTRPEGQHLTLKFLGETTAEQRARLKEEISDRVSGMSAVTIRLHAAGFFPSTRRPRVAWIGGEASGGAEVAAAVEEAAAASGFPREGRVWSLHLTQARLDRAWPQNAVERFLEWGRGLEIEPFECGEVVLFASDLRPGGAVYTRLERFPLE